MIKVLVIEDDINVRSNIHQLLEESGYDVRSAENGLEGLKAVKKDLPDVIICDIMMPEKDGYQVLQEISADPETAAIPFIFLTAKAEVSDIRYGMQSGADDYLLKPFTSAELLKAIELRLNKRSLIAQSIKTQNPAGQENTAPENKTLGYDSHVFLLIGNNPEIIKVNRIKYILSEGEYTNVFTSDGRKLLVRRLLREWEEILPKEHFLRIHRSTMINLEYVKKIEKWFNHSFRVHIEGAPEPFIVSRRLSTTLRSRVTQPL